MQFLRAAVMVVVALACIGAAVLQMMMAGETTTMRARNRLVWGFLVDSSEFTRRGLKLRGWRRICFAMGLGSSLVWAGVNGVLSLTPRPSWAHKRALPAPTSVSALYRHDPCSYAGRGRRGPPSTQSCTGVNCV